MHIQFLRLALLRILEPFSFIMAEEVGFEPTVLSHNGFQDRRLKPLGHSSVAYRACLYAVMRSSPPM
jgi:hypothetical protein